jgi:hypothetical protein
MSWENEGVGGGAEDEKCKVRGEEVGFVEAMEEY